MNSIYSYLAFFLYEKKALDNTKSEKVLADPSCEDAHSVEMVVYSGTGLYLWEKETGKGAFVGIKI